VSPEALLLGGYALFLLCAALVLEWLSAHTHRRALRYRTAGFDYDELQDHWTCPEGEHLWPHEFDHERRLVRYRAKARVCNACPSKGACTDSARGREVVRPLDPWPHSEAGRFHRVLSLTLVVLALVALVIGAVRNHAPSEAATFAVLLVFTLLVGRFLLRDLRAHPSGFPEPSISHGLRMKGGVFDSPAGQ
jgi:hypothetical protein